MPGVEQIYLPGEIEEKSRVKKEVTGIDIPDSIWNEIVKVANELKVPTPAV
jgi:LDH2 family malate/lactate/ureidoglycolate dehydrogenase